METKLEVCTIGGGCFWCIEGVFSRCKGIKTAISGYTGGKTKNPTYKDICEGNTGHAEVVQITYDPSIITFDNILEIFFYVHDPTTLNQQGNDKGTQYRSVIYYHNKEQKKKAKEYIQKLTNEKIYTNKIVTELTKLGHFYEAEKYHQDYYTYFPSQGYCKAVVGPKIKKYFEKYKDTFAQEKVKEQK
eukprot:TRINITY_DN1186_c0_g1_i1.p1 TRINITY_DN1186_c0_g1~~TRINITY_DN1186_c0_g1_i1.p1  ORF type:complete len:188 (-),score=55.62 TRINITY_DN1186_c0_g1_i1:24-587(-)